MKFETIYVVQPCHDFSSLAEHAKQIRFLTTGQEDMNKINATIEANLKEFEPETDALVAVGRVNSCLIAGIALGKLFAGKTIEIGIYGNTGEREQGKRKGYQWLKIRV